MEKIHAVDDARALAARAVAAGSERDTGSGNGVMLATLTDDGVTTEEYDDAAETY